MPEITPLIEIINNIDKVISDGFKNKTYWIKSEISGVRKAGSYNWYYLDFIDKSTDKEIFIRGLCRNQGSQSIRLYEKMTGSIFKSDISVTCKVQVIYYKDKNYPQLEILEIDYSTEVGRQEIEKRKTLDRLIKENPKHIRLEEGRYLTTNNSLILPVVIQKIALITGKNSDGQRDFLNSVKINEQKYDFFISEYNALMQGDKSSFDILEQLKAISKEKDFYDVVVICRGGGSDSDFNAFNNFDLANYICSFPIPILTGIGHDRNTSIVDMVSRQLMNPAQVGAFIIKQNIRFNANIQELERRIDNKVEQIIDGAKYNLDTIKQTLKNLSPENILKKGFAIVSIDNKIITDPKNIKKNSEMVTQLKAAKIYSKVSKIEKK